MSVSDGTELGGSSLFDLLMGAFDIDPDRPLQDAMKRKEVYDELTKLRRITADLAKKRLSSVEKLYVEERKRELEVAKAAVQLAKDLKKLEVESETDLAVAAIGAQQRAAQYIAKQRDRLYKPDMSRVRQKTLGGSSDMEIIQDLTGDPILETSTGLSAPADELVYARLLRFSKETNGAFFRLEGDEVVLGPRLEGSDNATILSLRDAVKQTYGAFADVEKTIEQSEQVRDEAAAIARKESDAFSPEILESLSTNLKLTSPSVEQAQKDVVEGLRVLEESDEELKGAERERERLEAELSRMPKDKVKAALAKAVANPRFRQWAESNGFRIGSADELGSESSYREGRDDVRAVMLFGIQDSTGMRVAKRKGRLVSVPSKEEFVTPFTESQQKMQDYVKALSKDSKAVLFRVPEDDGTVSYIDVKGGKKLLANGVVTDVAKDEIKGLADEDKIEALTADSEGFGEALKGLQGLSQKIRPAGSRQASGSGMYREIRLTAGDIRRGVRILQDIESGDIIEVPLDTEMEVIEDVRVPLTQRIGKRADERFFERERERFDKDLLREEELPRREEPSEEDEGKDPQRLADDQSRAETARIVGATRVGPGLPLSDEDELEMRSEQLGAAGMPQGRARRKAREDLDLPPSPGRFDQFLERMRELRGVRQQRKAERPERRPATVRARTEELKKAADAPAAFGDLSPSPVKKPFPQGLGGRTYAFGDLEFDYDPEGDTFTYRRGGQEAQVTREQGALHSALRGAMMEMVAPEFRPLSPDEISAKQDKE